MFVKCNKLVLSPLKGKVLLSLLHAEECHHIEMQYGDNFDCLKVRLISDSLLTLIIDQHVGLRAERTLQFEAKFCLTTFLLIEHLVKISDIKALVHFLLSILNDIEILIVN